MPRVNSHFSKKFSFDLLVLDTIMNAGIDGFETYKKVLELHPGAESNHCKKCSMKGHYDKLPAYQQ